MGLYKISHYTNLTKWGQHCFQLQITMTKSTQHNRRNDPYLERINEVLLHKFCKDIHTI